MRDRTKVGEMIGPSEPSPRPIPCVNVVLPAPRSPAERITSPRSSSWASRSPNRTIAPSGRNPDRQRQRLGQDHTMRNRAIDDEAAVLPEGNEVRELGRASSSTRSQPRMAASSSAAATIDDAMPWRCRSGWTETRVSVATPSGRGSTMTTPAGRPPTWARIPLTAPQAVGQRLSRLCISGRRWIHWCPRPESAVDDLNHRGRVLRRRDRNHKIRNRDAH